MKKIIRAIIECSVVCFAVMLIVHCRVIAAYLTGDKLPEAHEWHKKCFPCLKKEGQK